MREEILAEIRRLANDNNGQPPGRRHFEKQTGIVEGAWYGKFWARWSDAVAEAGYTANRAPEKISADVLLENLAHACRYFGKFPTVSEIKLYGRQHKGFPSHNTLRKTFVSHAEMRKQLVVWLNGDDSFVDVAAVLPSADTNRAQGLNFARDGSVYLIRSGAFYKIGRSDEIERRIKEIRVALPDAAKLVHTIKTDDPAGIEAYWHRRFDSRRANGEWFRLTSADVAVFKKRRFQ